MGYDSISELTSISSTFGGVGSQSFGYDNAGNPTTFKGTSQSFNPDNQNTALTFDGDGNPSTWGSNALTWDTNSKLTAIGSVLTAGYQIDGLRAWKKAGSSTTYFVYSGAAPVLEVNGSGAVSAVNTFGPNGLLSRHSGSADRVYTFDAQGNMVEGLTTSTGAVQDFFWYDPYGVRNGASDNNDPYDGYGARGAGELTSRVPTDEGGLSRGEVKRAGPWDRDTQTGLYLLGERYYDPAQGRFLNRDPAGYSGGLNLYRFANDAPLNEADPLGLTPCWMNDDGSAAFDYGYTSDLNAGDHPGISGAVGFERAAAGIVPGGMLIPAAFGVDFNGCKLSPMQRIAGAAMGVARALGGGEGEAGEEAAAGAEEAAGDSAGGNPVGGVARVGSGAKVDFQQPIRRAGRQVLRGF